MRALVQMKRRYFPLSIVSLEQLLSPSLLQPHFVDSYTFWLTRREVVREF